MERGGDPSMDLGGYAYSLLWGRARAYNLRRTPGEGEKFEIECYRVLCILQTLEFLTTWQRSKSQKQGLKSRMDAQNQSRIYEIGLCD